MSFLHRSLNALHRVERLVAGPVGSVRGRINRLRGVTWDQRFTVNRRSYPSIFLPSLAALGHEPATHVMTFLVRLPFDLAMPEENSFTIPVGHAAACTISIHRRREIRRISASAGFPAKFGTPLWVYPYAEAELTGYIVDHEHRGRSIRYSIDALSSMFDMMLERLNRYLGAYMVATQDDRVHHIGLRSLRHNAICTVFPTENWDAGETILFNLPGADLFRTILPEAKTLPDEAIENVFRTARIAIADANPFLLAEEFLVVALGAFHRGDYRKCVLDAQTAIEIFVRRLYRELALEEGRSSDELDEELAATTDFTRILREQFHNRLGGCWDSKKSTKPIGKWYEHTYRLRNRIVHAGHWPLHEEADDALADARDFRSYMVERVKTKRKKWPKTAGYFTVRPASASPPSAAKS